MNDKQFSLGRADMVPQLGVSIPPMVSPSNHQEIRSPNHSQSGRSPGSSGTIGTSSPRKRKLTLTEVAQLRRKVSENEGLRIVRAASRYAERCAVRCYLGGGGSPAEYPTWRNRLPPVPLISYLIANRLDCDNPSEDLYSLLRSNTNALGRSSSSTPSQDGAASSHSRVPGVSTPATSVAAGSSVPSSSHDRHHIKSPMRVPVSPYRNLSSSPVKHEVPGDVSPSSNQEHIVERARQEAYVVQRIAELQRDGLWSEKRVPKLQELPRPKAHWDYVLEEMVWLAADFAQERMWKKAAAKKCALMVQHYFRKKEEDAVHKLKAREAEQRRIAGVMAREVKLFWSDVEKLVDFKQKTVSEERKKRALSHHLSFIRGSVGSEVKHENVLTPTKIETSDDEERLNEILTLQKESQLPLEDLIGDYLDVRDKLPASPSEATDHSCDETTTVNSDNSDDDEEQQQKSVNVETDIEGEEDSVPEDDEESYEESSSDEHMEVDHSLNSEPDRSLEKVLEMAEGLKPKGNTLSTGGHLNRTPPLLRRKLREYQQVGFDWLVGMYDKKLNGILGDETGLGKMVQTIALLAHLACEKSNWGPHLIIVPTQEVFVWETEVKKWCPGLKILGYYGSVKERKLKRIGWTRPNSFHICITSYKIVIEDHLSFRRKKWKYLILDEAQYLKNLSSPRWQSLTNLRVQRKLLLIGKPLDESQFESFSEFLLPRDSTSLSKSLSYSNIFKPLSLFRVKNEVEEQLPRLNDHTIKCRLSNRQRYLYDDFMKKDETVSKLTSGCVIDVLKVLVHLKKICNHPDLVEDRHVVSPFHMEGLRYSIPSLVADVLNYDPFKNIDLSSLNCMLIDLENYLSAFVAHRARRFKTEKCFIEEIDSSPDAPQCPKRLGGIKISVQKKSSSSNSWSSTKNTVRSNVVQIAGGNNTKIQSAPKIGTSPIVKATVVQQNATSQGVTLRLANPIGQIQNYLQIVGQQGKVAQTARLAHIVNTPAGKQILISSPHQLLSSQPSTVVTSSGQRLTVVSKQGPTSLRPLLRLPPLAVTSSANIFIGAANVGDLTKTDASIDDSTKLLQENGNPKDILSGIKEDRSNEGISETESTENRKEKLKLIYRMNELRCGKLPVYGSDVVSVLTLDNKVKETNWRWTGSSLCRSATTPRNSDFNLLPQSILSFKDRLRQMEEVLSKFVMYVPSVYSPQVKLDVNRRSPSKLTEDVRLEECLKPVVTPLKNLLHPISLSMRAQFPDCKSIQYDCGKLQALNSLLRRLRSRRCRALIFTQMTHMLDILESYLKSLGYVYIRLDGSTRVDRRQVLTERFNNDSSVFCLISSTRSGCSGVNVTGANCVIFYDSDWNPSMDREAVLQCHRIGLAHNVDVYRFVSENTAEENFTDRYIQKRLLKDLMKQGDDFTQSYFKMSTIQDLFDVNISELSVDFLAENKKRRQSSEDGVTDDKEGKQLSISILERALTEVEDECDAVATLVSRAERECRLAEFEENSSSEVDEESEDGSSSKVELELETLEQQLSGVERYAMRFIVDTEHHLSMADYHWEQLKRGWETTRCQRDGLKRKRGDSLSDDEELTYSGVDARCQDWVTKFGLSMPLWAPPTPPQDDNDMYIDEALCLLYEPTLIPEAQLPPAYTKKDRKRSRMEMNIINSRLQSNKNRQKEETLVHAPRSLFDRPTPALVKMRQELRLQRYRGLMRPTVQNLLKPPLPVKPLPEPDHVPDWLVHEDWTILQAVQHVQEMTVNLVVLSPGHTPNWDLVADMVNMSSRTYRSPKQCRNRYESVIMPREEGKPVPDSPKKLKKNKILYKPPQLKSGRPLRTSQLFQQDNNSSMTQVMNLRFEAIRSVSNRRAPTVKPLLVDPTMKNNPRHADTLARSQIDYDRPLTPIEVAARRADRIAREKLLNSAPIQVAGINDQAQQLAVLRQQQLQKLGATAAGSSAGGATRQLATLTVQEMVATVGGNRTVVSSSGIPVNRSVTAEVKASGSSPSGASSSPTSPSTAGSVAASPATAKIATGTISATHLAIYRQQRQQAILRQQQQLKLLKTQQAASSAGGGGTPPKVSIAVTPPQSPAGGGTVSIPRMQQVVVKSGRAVTESEMVALLKRQQAAKVTQGQASPATLTTQILTSIQVKALNTAATAGTSAETQQTTTTTVLPQQVKQLAVQQQLLAAAAAAHQRAGTKMGQQKVTQFGQVATKMAGGGTQLIVQSGHKTIPTTVTVQNLQQVIKQVRPGHVVVAGPGRGPTLPGTVSLEGRQILAGALKTSQQAILTQVSAVLPGSSRAQTPIVSAPLITIPPSTGQSPNHSTPPTDASSSQHH